MKKWPFEPLVFSEKTPQEMCDAAKEKHHLDQAIDAFIKVGKDLAVL